MSRGRFLLLLGAALLAIAGAFWMSAQPHLARATLAGESVFPKLEASLNTVSRVRLTRADGSAVNLVRDTDGWKVEERGYPADSGRVRKLLIDLATLAVVEEKTHDPRNYPKLGVEDLNTPGASGVRVELTATPAVPPLIVGKTAGSKGVYVRHTGAEASFLASPQLVLDTAPRSWLDRGLLDLKAERVRDITITLPAAAPYTVTRDAPGAEFRLVSLPKGRTAASPDVVGAAASSLATFTIDDVGPVPGGAPAAGYHATLRCFDGLVIELLGRKTGEVGYLGVSARFDPALRPAAATLRPAAEVEGEARAIAARAAGREFRLATYRFDGLFRPLDSLLMPLPAAKAPFNASARPVPR
jgi:hypothetical protein